MQEYFTSEFSGKKSDIDKLIKFISNKAQTDAMYGEIEDLIQLPRDYFKKDKDKYLSITIGLSSSCKTNFFDPCIYFHEVSEAVPELEMNGSYNLLDSDVETRYNSKAGSSEVDEEDFYEDYEDEDYEDYEDE